MRPGRDLEARLHDGLVGAIFLGCCHLHETSHVHATLVDFCFEKQRCFRNHQFCSDNVPLSRGVSTNGEKVCKESEKALTQTGTLMGP